jgi:hypothetical protein
MKEYSREEIKALITTAVLLDIALYEEMTFADIEAVVKYFALKEQRKEVPND